MTCQHLNDAQEQRSSFSFGAPRQARCWDRFYGVKHSVLGKNVCSRYSTVTNFEIPDSLSIVGAYFLEYPRGKFWACNINSRVLREALYFYMPCWLKNSLDCSRSVFYSYCVSTILKAVVSQFLFHSTDFALKWVLNPGGGVLPYMGYIVWFILK